MHTAHAVCVHIKKVHVSELSEWIVGGKREEGTERRRETGREIWRKRGGMKSSK